MTHRVMVVDDDPSIRRILCSELSKAGYGASPAENGQDAICQLELQVPDIIVTDLAMPEADGFALIAHVRRSSQTPIIVLSVREGESDKIRALDLGADDYVVKPISLPELLARVRTQLRRSRPQAPILRFEDLTIDVERHLVRQGDRDIHLTPREFAILAFLAERSGRPVPSQQILKHLWSPEQAVTNDAVRVHVGSLRRKIEPDPSQPRYIVTEPWVGYRFIAEPVD